MIVSAVAFAAALALSQGVTVNIGVRSRQDSAAAARAQQEADSAARAREAGRAARDSVRGARRRARVVPVTAEHMRTAFSDVRAQMTLERARAARVADDSALLGYDAKARERASVGMSLTRLGRERLLARYERVVRVQWRRDRGARVDVLGERTTAPMLGSGSIDVELGSVPSIPYFPGREPLWGSAMARMDIIDSDVVNPLARGAEAYYTYESGDSLSFRIGGETQISVRELRIRPRKPDWRVSVGSLWFDDASGRLVRAVYRMAEPMDIWKVEREEDGEGCDAPRVICSALNPMTANVSVVAVEYGLHEGRFWLPRLQTLDGSARVGIMRVPFKLEQSFTYDEVNGMTDFAPVVIAAADTSRADTAAAARRAARRAPCAPGDSRERVFSRFENTLPVSVRTPCDSLVLARSPELPESPYDPGEEIFSSAELDELTERALGLAAQAGYMRSPPELRYGLGMTRYNRIEGLSTGIAAKQSLGGGYTARASVRLGLADLQPNAELSLLRGNGRIDVGTGIYRRLAAANDWGDPLGFGNSVSALLLGRDEGFYYRTWGAELTRGPAEGSRGILSRLFVEHHSDAETETSLSLARGLNGRRFGDNIDAVNGTISGLSLRHVGSRGLDPHGFRLLSDIRIEGATGSFDYSRAAADFTVSHGLGSKADGALTVGGGTSGGSLPMQRWWFLGGAHTVRGQSPATRAGDSYWLARGEIGSSFVLARPVIFADFGWAGDRADFSSPGTPISGAGVGASFLDGLVRFDLAKGIRPSGGVRGYLYIEARF
ncbi:MAG: ShlB/FhaC/HecB family hemolysin secretion/activation protein [Gemmatimonadaceae bacterium]